MQISMRIQIIVGIWVRVSMMDFMPQVRVSMKQVFFATFTGKAVRRRGVTFMST